MRLLGIDRYSLDQEDDATLPAHRILAAHRIPVVVMLNLRDVPPGRVLLGGRAPPLASSRGEPGESSFFSGEVPPVSNPWLTIDAGSYIGHMKLVGQSAVLRRVLLDVYNSLRPPSLLVLGCSTGEDLLEVDFTQTGHVVGLDVNPDHVALARIATAGLPTEFFCQDVLSTIHSCSLPITVAPRAVHPFRAVIIHGA